MMMFETETVGLCLIQKLKWGEGEAWTPLPPILPGPSSGCAPVYTYILLLIGDFGLLLKHLKLCFVQYLLYHLKNV